MSKVTSKRSFNQLKFNDEYPAKSSDRGKMNGIALPGVTEINFQGKAAPPEQQSVE